MRLASRGAGTAPESVISTTQRAAIDRVLDAYEAIRAAQARDEIGAVTEVQGSSEISNPYMGRPCPSAEALRVDKDGGGR
jgi:hypothetical protein